MEYSEKLVTDDHLETPSWPPTWPASLPASEITSTISSSRLLLLKIYLLFVVMKKIKSKYLMQQDFLLLESCYVY